VPGPPQAGGHTCRGSRQAVRTLAGNLKDQSSPVARTRLSTQPMFVGAEITWDGCISLDANRDALSYKWEEPTGNGAERLFSAEGVEGPRLRFVPTKPGSYVVTLTVAKKLEPNVKNVQRVSPNASFVAEALEPKIPKLRVVDDPAADLHLAVQVQYLAPPWGGSFRPTVTTSAQLSSNTGDRWEIHLDPRTGGGQPFRPMALSFAAALARTKAGELAGEIASKVNADAAELDFGGYLTSQPPGATIHLGATLARDQSGHPSGAAGGTIVGDTGRAFGCRREGGTLTGVLTRDDYLPTEFKLQMRQDKAPQLVALVHTIPPSWLDKALAAIRRFKTVIAALVPVFGALGVARLHVRTPRLELSAKSDPVGLSVEVRLPKESKYPVRDLEVTVSTRTVPPSADHKPDLTKKWATLAPGQMLPVPLGGLLTPDRSQWPSVLVVVLQAKGGVLRRHFRQEEEVTTQ